MYAFITPHAEPKARAENANMESVKPGPRPPAAIIQRLNREVRQSLSQVSFAGFP